MAKTVTMPIEEYEKYLRAEKEHQNEWAELQQQINELQKGKILYQLRNYPYGYKERFITVPKACEVVRTELLNRIKFIVKQHETEKQILDTFFGRLARRFYREKKK